MTKGQINILSWTLVAVFTVVTLEQIPYLFTTKIG